MKNNTICIVFYELVVTTSVDDLSPARSSSQRIVIGPPRSQQAGALRLLLESLPLAPPCAPSAPPRPRPQPGSTELPAAPGVVSENAPIGGYISVQDTFSFLQCGHYFAA